MTVSANVETACTVSATEMAFGTVIPGVVKETTATVTCNCTNGTQYTVNLGDGLWMITTGGTGGEYRRQMASGDFRMPYVIYKDSARTTAIDATAGELNNLQTTIGANGTDQEYEIYGQVKAAETTVQEAGAYVDTVIVTIGF